MNVVIGIFFAALVTWGFLFVFGKTKWPFGK